MTELEIVQEAVYKMMKDNGLDRLPNPVTVPTNDMSLFPDTSVCGVDKLQDINGCLFFVADKSGYVLYEHDAIGDNVQVNLINYVSNRHTENCYIVDTSGKVSEVESLKKSR